MSELKIIPAGIDWYVLNKAPMSRFKFTRQPIIAWQLMEDSTLFPIGLKDFSFEYWIQSPGGEIYDLCTDSHYDSIEEWVATVCHD